MLEQDIQHDTNKGYQSSFRQYLRFCEQFNIQPLPASELTVLYWLAYRTTEVQASSTLTNYYGFKKIAKYHGFPIDDTNWDYLKLAKATIKQRFGARTPNKRLPTTIELASDMYQYFNMNNYNDVVYYTMIICAITGLMRTSEICAKNKQVSPTSKAKASVKALWNRNLTSHTNKHGIIEYFTCTIRATKTEKGYCDVETVWPKGPFPVSPADLMLHYLTLRLQLSKTQPQLSSKPKAPLFQLLDGTIVTIKDLRNRFNILCADMGLDPTRYTIYSFRIGGATSLAQRGVDHRMIQIAGRWTSDAYKLYVKMTPAMMAKHQTNFVSRKVTHPELVFMHENIPTNLLVQA